MFRYLLLMALLTFLLLETKCLIKTMIFFVNPIDIAATIYHLCTQNRSAWSFEVEARPFSETW